MTITYKTNAATTTKSMTEWFFGKEVVRNLTASALRMNKKTGKTEFRFWQDGTGYHDPDCRLRGAPQTGLFSLWRKRNSDK